MSINKHSYLLSGYFVGTFDNCWCASPPREDEKDEEDDKEEDEEEEEKEEIKKKKKKKKKEKKKKEVKKKEKKTKKTKKLKSNPGFKVSQKFSLEIAQGLRSQPRPPSILSQICIQHSSLCLQLGRNWITYIVLF